MLLILAMAVAGFMVWLAVLGLLAWREAAEDRARRAARDHLTVLAGAALAEEMGPQAPPGGLEVLARRTAEANGLTPVPAPGSDGSSVGVGLEAGASRAVFTWVAQLESQGVRVMGFAALKNPDGTLQVDIDLSAS